MPNINTETENIIEKENVIENIIGMAFLTSQTYINGTIADIKFFSIKPDEINKWLLFKKYGKLLPGNNVTSIELCYAYANYYKHHEEWKSITGRNRDTIETLTSAGIEIFSNKGYMIEVPFSRIIDLLLTTEKGIELNVLINILSEWRNLVMASIIQ